MCAPAVACSYSAGVYVHDSRGCLLTSLLHAAAPGQLHEAQQQQQHQMFGKPRQPLCTGGLVLHTCSRTPACHCCINVAAWRHTVQCIWLLLGVCAVCLNMLDARGQSGGREVVESKEPPAALQQVDQGLLAPPPLHLLTARKCNTCCTSPDFPGFQGVLLPCTQ